ncbi:MAG: hypothetical protein FJ102_16755 [Deltaproteobacteria bacterium]|nr:hypothetical protein [Deltaproteobacteria bacterium]
MIDPRAALDWEAVLAALLACVRTPMGAERARSMVLLPSAGAVNEAYRLVDELMAARMKGESPPVNGVADVRPEVGRAARGVVLEAWALISVGGAIAGLVDVAEWLSRREGPALQAMGSAIDVPGGVGVRLQAAFDRDGQLSDAAWPKLASLRRQCDSLRAAVQQAFDAVLADEGWGDMLQERYVTERDGRLVVPVKMSHRKGLGIVHGSSHSGETAFVEPGHTVELQNDLRAVRDAIEAETFRILGELSGMVARVAVPLLAGVELTGELDLAAAKADLGFQWDGNIPRVGADGVVDLRRARHPVLALRPGASVVANDLRLDSVRRCLVLTGPNAGGKTVALKTVGLCAVLARLGIPLPAAADSRLDFFDPIVADIGDVQSVAGDLSTFSGHVLRLKEAIEIARAGVLVLVDEVAVGTDPAQGAALAAAVVEALVEANARVVVTTHYPELKAAADERIVVAGMEFADGRPTYRLVVGQASGSQALVVAQRMGMPERVLARATSLLDERAAQVARLLGKLEAEREDVRLLSRQVEAQAAGLAARETELATREKKLQDKIDGERQRLVEATRDRLARMEAELRDLVKSLHAAPSLKAGNAGLQVIRAARAGLDEEQESSAPAYAAKVGEKVWVTTVAQHGVVAALHGKEAEVQVRSMRLRVPLSRLEAKRGGGK